MKFILATKENMVQFFGESGVSMPATLLSAGPIAITQVKDKDKDGYSSVQVGFGSKNKKNITKSEIGHLKGLGPFRVLKEFSKNNLGKIDYKIGDLIDASVFEVGDIVSVSGVSKGKGFQGVVKRHGFHGGPRSHGQKHSEREPGSIGATGPQRVFKGMRMAGRMGGDRISVKNLKILAVDKENNKILVSGAVPGRRGTLLEIVG